MSDLGASTGWGLLIGASLLAGALVAAGVRLPKKAAATLTAFGGGILFAAVALELVPEADAEAGPGLTALGLIAGALVYVGADRFLNRDHDTKMMRQSAHAASAGREMAMPSGGGSGSREVARGESIAAGLFVDGVPESIALGLTVAEGEVGIALLAGIVVGNLVEAYGAAQPIVAGGRSRRFAVGLLGGIGLVLALATVLGGTVLADASAELIGTAQAVAAGAVLAVVSIAIIPHAFEEVSGLVATATVLGFIGGYLLS
ncbi:MAG: ZIP family metal transporter [Thermoleophilaceae bacterium]